ncbi:MAG: hypothetical protein JNK58_06810 [Phycisphaerae bacterium]|nr:hypothetical protein [Phycisphaerae bacterium]
MNTLRSAPLALTLALAANSALARDADPATDPSAPRWNDWTIRIEPIIWAPALRGDIKMPGAASIDVGTINADEVNLAPAGRVTIRADKWSFLFRGFAFAVDEDAAEIDLAGFDLTAGYNLWTPIDDPENQVRLAFDLFGGVRIHSIDASIAAANSDNTWFEPIGGARINLDLPHRFGLNVSLDGGGFSSGEDSSFSWDITVAFSWRPIENLGLEIGFRHLQADLVEGDGADEFEFDGALAGLFGSVVIRF